MSDEELCKRLREGATWDDDVAAADRIEALTAERDELQQVFDFQWRAHMRAVEMWRTANPGNDLVLPDSAKLTVWMLEQLKAARADAKEAEAYAEGLERDLKTCCMAQTVMDNTVAELEAKLSTCEEIGRAFEEDAGQLRDKLAKAVEIAKEAIETMASGPFFPEEEERRLLAKLAEVEGEKACPSCREPLSLPSGDVARATLAEIEGGKG